MQPGDVVDERFGIEALAGSGGMGHVYRAQDRSDGGLVALKVLRDADPVVVDRFAREAVALSATQLPGVVRYVAHGETPDGRPYLAMQWLDGETLADRLLRGALTISATVSLASRIATTLGAVHRLGLIHRDLKPSNLLLASGEIDRVTLIDFGVARVTGDHRRITTPGTLVGTPGYMAPEQARGQLDIDARVDVFSLGCVIYQCLAARAPFEGAGVLAVLAKVLLEQPSSLREARRDVPPWLDDLVMRMLAKSPAERPRDGDAVAAELTAMATSSSGCALRPETATAPVRDVLTTDERKVMCVVLARERSRLSRIAPPDERDRALCDLVLEHRGTLELIHGRSPLVVITGAGTPADLAARAARCALAIQKLLGGTPVAIATGRAEIAGQLPVGELIDRAAQLLPSSRRAEGARSIRIDEVTAAMIERRFETTRDDEGCWLLSPREEAEAPPQLLGRRTPCVGRDRELHLLINEFIGCMEDSAAAALLVTGPAGIGKTRLRQEFVRALLDRGEPLELWLGRAGPLSAGSAFGLIGHALRRDLGIVDGEGVEERRRKVQAHVARRGRTGAEHAAAFLGELVGASFPDDSDVQLRAARQSLVLMGDQLRWTCEELVRAECSEQPLLLVLEDLHWGDLPTVTLIDGLLRSLKHLPFVVLALARPEVHQAFPKLWEGRRGQEIRLTPLSRRASTRLAREMLGDDERPELIDRLVQRADGNPFYLEEHIRAVASGREDALPETLVAMVHAALEELAPELRRVLRAASIFGETFTQAGVAALTGGPTAAPTLRELEQRELIRRDRAGATERGEWCFRHALVREAAYGMLTARDRQLGHALAGRWLEQTSDADPMALAEHFERGGESARAAAAYLKAAARALSGNDSAAAIERAERGVARTQDPAIAGALRLVQADAHRWRGEYAHAEQQAINAAELLQRGSAAWYGAISQAATAASRLGAFERVERWSLVASEAVPIEGATAARITCLAALANELTLGGRYEMADAALDLVAQITSALPTLDVQIVADLSRARSTRAFAAGDLAAALRIQHEALAAMEQMGDRRRACLAASNIAHLQVELGDFDGIEVMLRAALASAEQLGLPAVVANIQQNFGQVLAHDGRLDEAVSMQQAAVDAFQRLSNPRMEGSSRSYLAMILLLSGALETAETEARTAAARLVSTPPLRGLALATQAMALLALGRAEDALVTAREALALADSMGAQEGDALVRVVFAEAVAASGDAPGARAAIAAARDKLLARAAKIQDATWRERFLGAVPANARTLELARLWVDEPAS